MSERSLQNRALIMLIFVMAFWAGNSIIGRAVRFDIPPFTLAFFRWSGALLIVAPFALAAVRRDMAAIRAGWLPILVLGLLGVGAFNTLLYQGLRYTHASNALLLQAGIPTMVVLFDRLIFGVRAGRGQLAATALSTLGVLAIVFQGDPTAAARLRFGTGDVIILAAVTAWALYTVLLRLRPPIAPISFIFVTFLIGALAMAPLSLWEALSGPWVNWTLLAFTAIGYVALLPSLAAYFMFNFATATLGPARAGQAITLMPLFGALASALILGERLEGYHFAGMACIVGGIAISMLGLRGKESAGANGGGRIEGRE